MIWDLLVIGGGPAGLFAAGEASEHLKKILLLEKQPEPGRKLLLTGSGQCNFTNIRPLREFLLAYGEHGLFLKPALHQWTNLDSIAFFERYGLASMTVEDTGKVFPRTRRAADVLRVLLKRCQAQGVLMEYHRPVTRVKREADGTFQVFSGTQVYRTRQLLLATGGCSYPATGSTGDGYALAAALGHTCIPPRPGLTSFIIRNFPWTHLPGTSFKNLPLTIWHHDQKVKTLTGDWLITHQGISGPAVQNLSRYACAGDWVTAALVPFASLEVFKREWEARLAHSARLTLKAWLKLFPLTQALIRTLLELAELSPAETVARLSREKRSLLFAWLTAFPLEIKSLGDFNTAMVTCGGVSLKEVNPKTMASRLVPGLYFAGEVLDIDGDCGGYDLQAAWSTAALAARSMTVINK